MLRNMSAVRIVTVNGSLSRQSRTGVLLRALADRTAAPLGAAVRHVELAEIAPDFIGALSVDELGPRARAALEEVESADVLVAGSPIFRATYTGLFKHFFDFVGQHALTDVPTFLAATGGSTRHSLVIEHQFRPLFAFFQALTLPLGVFGSSDEFGDDAIASAALDSRIDRAVEGALPILRGRLTDPLSLIA